MKKSLINIGRKTFYFWDTRRDLFFYDIVDICLTVFTTNIIIVIMALKQNIFTISIIYYFVRCDMFCYIIVFSNSGTEFWYSLYQCQYNIYKIWSWMQVPFGRYLQKKYKKIHVYHSVSQKLNVLRSMFISLFLYIYTIDC